MNFKDIKKILEENKVNLSEKYYVKEIGVFGSFRNNQQKDNSDIDILVNFNKPVGWEFFDLSDYLEEILQKKVDLVTPNALKKQIKENILSEVEYIW